MKMKYIILIFLIVLIIISISQIFSIPPYAGDIYSVYRSGYFQELDRQFAVIRDSFLGIKMLAKPVYGWIFLEDIRKEHDIEIRVYNSKGYEVLAPGEVEETEDRFIVQLLNSIEAKPLHRVAGGDYLVAFPIRLEKRCRFCHNSQYRKNIIGAMTFKREYDASIYYSAERVVLFTFISLMLLLFLYAIVIWDPEKKIKELFDKR
jgi:hypothetical protein